MCGELVSHFKLSSRGLVQMMSERGIALAHTTVLRGCSATFRSLRSAGFSTPGRSAGRDVVVTETYIKVKGQWTYLYRALDKQGQAVDFLLRERADVAKRTNGSSARQWRIMLHHGSSHSMLTPPRIARSAN